MTQAVQFEGVFPILATPFDEQENLDLPSLVRLIRFMSELGVDGVTILGVLGEANRMTDSEREAVIRTAVEAADGRLPIVVGSSHRGTHATRSLSLQAQALGAAGVMVTPSQEPLPSEARVFEYFERIADGLEIPIVVQDHPASSGVHMSVDLLLRLIKAIPQVACIKAEAVPTAPKIRALTAAMDSRRIPILTGLGALYGRFDLAAGSSGFMTGFAFPEVLLAMVSAARANDTEKLENLYQRFLPLIVFEQQPGVAMRKEILRRRGLMASARVRHPGGGLPPGATADIDRLLQQMLSESDIMRPITL